MSESKTTLQEKNRACYDDIISIVDKKIEQVFLEIESDKSLVKKLKSAKLNKTVSIYPIVSYILSNDNSLCSMKERKFDAEIIYQVLIKFKYFIMKLSQYQTVIPTRELFCMFIGWNTSIYQSMVDDEGEVGEVMNMVEDYIIDFNMSEAQKKNINASVTKFRTQVSGKHGHSQVTKKEEIIQNRSDNRKDKDQLEAELEKLKIQSQQQKALK